MSCLCVLRPLRGEFDQRGFSRFVLVRNFEVTAEVNSLQGDIALK